jgi:hypothetical protein
MTPLDMVVGKLRAGGFDPSPTGSNAYESRCPAHEGKRKNLSVGVGEDGRVLLHCHHAGENGNPSCSVDAIVGALGLGLEDLYPRSEAPTTAPKTSKKKTWGTLKAALDAKAFYVEPKPAKVEWWTYEDAAGKFMMTVARFTAADGEKTYLPYVQGPSGWVSGDPPGLLPLYQLPEVTKAGLIIITEGEKCADAVRAMSLTATTSAHGASSADKSDWAPLAGKDVVILPDNDAAGEGYLKSVLAILGRLTPRPRVKVIRLPDLGPSEDVADWVPRTKEAAVELERLQKASPDVDLDAIVGNSWESDPPDSVKTGDSAPSPKVRGTVGKSKSKKSGQQKEGPSQATVLLSLASSAKLFHSPDAKCFARVNVDNHVEIHEIRSTAFRRWLIRSYYARQKSPPASDAIQTAIATLEAKATYDGPEESVYVRVAPGPDDSIFVDLGNPAWNAVKVSANGWEVVADPPVRFIRPKGLRPLPAPERGGSLDLLRKRLTIGNQDWRLFIAWLTQAIRPKGPYPVLLLAGEQGTAKSTTARIARMHIDPHVTMLRSEPRENRDLMIGACNGWVVALDNVSHLADWLSDGLCRLATGGGFATRSLYSNDEEVYLDATRPIVIASIEDVVRRGDLADRCLTLTLDPIAEAKRRTEAAVWSDVETDSPLIMGAILDAVAGGLRTLPTVKLSKLPRMADFAIWGEAVCRGLGNQPGDFLSAYTDNRKQANESVLEDSPVAHFVKDLAASKKWQGTSRELLDELAGLAGEKTVKSKRWPKSPRALSGILRRLAPSLRMVGITLEFTLQGHAKTRTITIENVPPENACTQPSAPSAPSACASAASVLPGETADASADGRKSQPSALRPQPSAPSAPNPENIRVADDADDADGRKRPFSGDAFGRLRERFEL